MRHLHWETCCSTNEPYLKANLVHVNIDFSDICENASWGGHNYYLDISFSIHKRKRSACDDSEWTHQLLIPNGCHFYCKSEEEAKDIAEKAYKKMRVAFEENSKKFYQKQTDYRKQLNKTKQKKRKLLSLLNKRGINGEVYYSNKHPLGWMFVWSGKTVKNPDRLGFNFVEAVDFIESGTLDFLNEEARKQRQSV